MSEKIISPANRSKEMDNGDDRYDREESREEGEQH